jgi:hypothetical protein
VKLKRSVGTSIVVVVDILLEHPLDVTLTAN